MRVEHRRGGHRLSRYWYRLDYVSIRVIFARIRRLRLLHDFHIIPTSPPPGLALPYFNTQTEHIGIPIAPQLLRSHADGADRVDWKRRILSGPHAIPQRTETAY